MRVLITAVGSYGDVHPMVGLGKTLQQRGHEVLLFSNSYFEEMILNAGLKFVSLGTKEKYTELMSNPDLWHPIKGPLFVMREGVSANVRQMYQAIEPHLLVGQTILCPHPLDFSSRMLAEQYKIPIVSLSLAPIMFWSVEAPPKIPCMLTSQWIPKWFKKFQFRMADFVIDRMIQKEINQLRNEIGLPTQNRFFGKQLHHTDGVIGMFPDWFAKVQTDWPQETKLTGFPLWDNGSSTELSPQVREFVASERPTVLFIPGSAVINANDYFKTAVAACEKLNFQGLLLTKYAEQIPENLPKNVRHFGFLPLSDLLPSVHAFVHHGGIGSCGQGLAAGVPQIIRPMAHDQFDNAFRIEKLGVGKELLIKNFSVAQLVKTLTELIESETVAAACAQYQNMCNGKANLAAASQKIEDVFHAYTR